MLLMRVVARFTLDLPMSRPRTLSFPSFHIDCTDIAVASLQDFVLKSLR